MLLLILALVMLTLSPLAGPSGAAAQDDGDGGQAQETQEAEQPQATEEVPEVTEEVQETEPAVETEPVETEPVVETEEATEEAEETPENELLGAIEVEYRECPADYDIATSSVDDVLMECDQVDGVAFQVTTSDGNTLSQSTGEFGDSHVSFTELPTGSTTVRQVNAPGDVFVTCEGIVQNGGPETGVLTMTVTNGAIEWDLLDEEVAFCNWFVTGADDPAEDADSTPDDEVVGSVNVNYWECPPTTDLATADPAVLDTDCTDSPNGVPFRISNAGGVIETQNTGDINDGVVAFAEVPAGEVTIAQITAASVPRVFCEGIVSNGGPETGLMELTATSGSVDWNLLDDEVVYCDWYASPAGGEPSDLTIYKWLCPEDYDYTAQGADPKADCTTPQDGVNFTLDHPVEGETDVHTMTGDSLPGAVRFGGIAPGGYTIIETPPADTGSAFLWDCETVAEEEPVILFQDAPISEGFEYQMLIPSGVEITCNWFNVPMGDGNTVTIYKWLCPEGTAYDQDQTWYETNCTQYSDDSTFTLTSTAGTSSTTPNTGQYQWTGVPMGPIGIQETIPAEYGAPVVYCGASTTETDETPSILAATYERYDAPTGYVSHDIPDPSGYNFYCQWFNIPGGPGEITIYKWTCPEGYDLYAYGADPKADCPEATDGVTFFLDVPDPADTDLQTDTGDSIPGAVYFGGLEPGDYTVTEEVPAGTWYVFVLECDGLRDGMVRPYPLSMGDTLTIDLAAGDKVVCHWFNVPGYDPEYGRVTVTKYWCSTPTYVSEVDCQIYEEGIEFDLLVEAGAGWDVYDTETTDGAGKIIWQNLEPGTYWLEERNQNWCALYASTMNSDKESFAINANEETIVKVYNCELDPPSGKKPPTKYPNTGVGPSGSGTGTGPVALPSIASLVAPLLGFAVLTLRRLRATFATGQRPSAEGPTGRPGRGWLRPALTIGPLVALAALTGLLAIGPAIAQDTGDGGDEADATPDLALCLPEGGTPTAGTDGGDAEAEADDSAGDQDAETPAGDDPNIAIATGETSLIDERGGHNDQDSCVRGEVPARITIEPIGVDAGIEVLETVGGEMQQPTGPEDAAWYKESARIGEIGNIVIAGHLNWWNVPEAVFGRIATLRPGDTIVLIGEDGTEATYVVERVTQEDAFAEPAAEVIGNVDEPTLTLITCGGEWDAAESLYNERTVVRAVQVTDEEVGTGS